MDVSCPKLKACIARAKDEGYRFNCMICKVRHGKPVTTKSQDEEVKTMDTTEKKVAVKVCSKCIKELPATPEYFSKNMSTPDHLERWCKTCKQKAGKDMRDRKRKEKVGADMKASPENERRRKKIPTSNPVPVQGSPATSPMEEAIKTIERLAVIRIIRDTMANYRISAGDIAG
jgi:hypothetical protein